MIRKLIFYLILFTLFIIMKPVLSFGLDNFTISGELSNYFSYSLVDEESLLNRDNMLDLGAYEYATSFFAKGLNTLWSDKVHYFFNVRGSLSYFNDYNIRGENIIDEGKSYFIIDELFLDADLFPFYLLIGKHRISWGNALIFNMLNFINPEKIAGNTKFDHEGVICSKIDYANSFFNTTLYYIADVIDRENNFDYTASSIAMKMLFSFYDMEFGVYGYQQYKYEEPADFPVFSATVNYLIPELNLFLFSDAMYERGSLYHYIDSDGNEFMKEDEGFITSSTGFLISNQFDDYSLSIGCEYLYNGKGYSDTERQNYFNTLENLYADFDTTGGDPGPIFQHIGLYKDYLLNRHYLGFSVRFMNIMNHFDFSTLCIIPFDTSWFLKTDIFFYPLDYILFNVFLQGAFEIYNEDTEYGNFLIPFRVGAALKIVF